jgi:hypothetical protein
VSASSTTPCKISTRPSKFHGKNAMKVKWFQMYAQKCALKEPPHFSGLSGQK